MALFAAVFPVSPGQSENWHSWMQELNGARRDDFVASRRAAGVRERTFLQSTPMGDLVIVILEGDDPEAAFGQMMSADDDFTRWFKARAAEAHGVDLSQPLPPHLSTLILDTDG